MKEDVSLPSQERAHDKHSSLDREEILDRSIHFASVDQVGRDIEVDCRDEVVQDRPRSLSLEGRIYKSSSLPSPLSPINDKDLTVAKPSYLAAFFIVIRGLILGYSKSASKKRSL